MKGFLRNIVIQSFAILGICIVLGLALYSIKANLYTYYEQKAVIDRAENFQKLDDNVNTVFIGSSRIFRHVNPNLFDSLVDGSKSYNLGYAAMFPFRSYDYLDYLSLEDNKDIKHIFIELSPIALLGKNYNTDPFIYSANFDQYLQVLNYCLVSKYEIPVKLKYLSGYSLLILYKYMGIGSAKYLNHYMWGSPEDLQEKNSEKVEYHKGYLSLDEDLSRNGDNYVDLKSRQEGFNQNHKKELGLYFRSYDAYEKNTLAPKMDNLTKYIIEKINVLKKQGKEVHFIISPRQQFGDLYYLKGQKQLLSNYHILDFSNPSLYPELYNKENSFDRVHLNENGANLFTISLANQVKEKAIF